ncbi:MAG: transposase domain-containing protein, partial [Geminicoccaceae bacterium]
IGAYGPKGSAAKLSMTRGLLDPSFRPYPAAAHGCAMTGDVGLARGWAIVASLVATAKLNGVEPQAWLTDVLERMVSGRTKVHELERLLPRHWKTEQLAVAVNA